MWSCFRRCVMTIRLPISESFVSLQGEGMLTGVPSFFVRLSGCNLRCVWCDTPHASWEPEGSTRTIDEILAELDAMMRARGSAAGKVQHVVVTGGEPFIFAHLGALCDALRGRGLHVTIETAGTVFAKVDAQLLSLSPKLRNSTPWNDPRDADGSWAKRHEERRINLDALAAFVRHYAEYQLKFVVAREADVREVEELISQIDATLVKHAASAGGAVEAKREQRLCVDPLRVMLMPEGLHPAKPGTRDWLVRACVERGWRYCHRVHIDLFGHVRGT